VSFAHFLLNPSGIFCLKVKQTSVDCWTAAGLISTLQPRMSRFHTVGAVLVDVCAHESEAIVSRVLMVRYGDFGKTEMSGFEAKKNQMQVRF